MFFARSSGESAAGSSSDQLMYISKLSPVVVMCTLLLSAKTVGEARRTRKAVDFIVGLTNWKIVCG